MAKKTATKSAKPNQQRAKEEQWRRRMAAQARAGTPTATAVRGEDDDVAEETMSETYAPVSASNGRASSPVGGATRASRVQSSAVPASQRRLASAAQQQRSARMRMAANSLSMEDEMRYVKGDIRMLVVLTVVCIVVLLVLSFLIR